MLTPNWHALRPHATQSALWRTKARFTAVVAGRGSGKTELARRRIVRYLSVRKSWSDPIYLYALPTYKQAKRIAWKEIKQLIPSTWIRNPLRDINEGDLTIRTIFGSELYVMGMDKPQRAEGVQWDGIVIDESSDQKPGMFATSLLPAMTHRNAWAWRIGVPKRHGIGATEFKAFFDECAKRAAQGHTDYAAFTWPSSDILTSAQLNEVRSQLDAKDFAEQFEASWEKSSGRVFYAFDDLFNVTLDAQYNVDLPLIIGSDFNVDPMAWVVCQQHETRNGSELHVIDEVWLRDTNTQATLDHLAQRFAHHEAGFQFFGDATGRARKTAASSSDYILIKSHPFFANKSSIHYPKANPMRKNRVAACNALFCNALGVRRCFVSPRAQHLIRDLNDRVYAAGTTEIDDYGDIGHISDALGYIIHRLYPVRYMLEEASTDVLIMN